MNKKFIKSNSEDYESILKLGLIDVKEKNILSAKKKFEKLIEINKFKFEGYLNLSTIYSFQGDSKKAHSILNEFLENIEENSEVINSIAINLVNMDKLDELNLHIKKYIHSHPSHILFYLQGYIYVKNNKITESEKSFLQSINLNLKFWNSYEFLLKQYEKQSRINDFKNLIDKAKKIFLIISLFHIMMHYIFLEQTTSNYL